MISTFTGRRPMAQIVFRASRWSGYTMSEIKGPTRSKDLCWVRFAVMWAMKVYLGASSTQVGKILDDRDHTTVLYGWERARILLDADPAFADFVKYLTVSGRLARAEDFGFSGKPFERLAA